MDTELVTSIFSIILIDIVLGGDNAIVIALACRNLPENLKNKAIVFGTGLAIVSRIFLTIIVVYLLKIPYVMLVGGLLLIAIALNLLKDEDHNQAISGETTLIGAVKTIIFADIVMGLDNVLGIAGAASGNIMLVVVGLLFSVPIIIWGSKLILYLMERFQFLIYIGASILSYTAGKMITSEERLRIFFLNNPTFEWLVIVIIIICVILIGWFKNNYREANS